MSHLQMETTMQRPDGMSTPTTRKRVSQACMTCGQKKIKCDGQMPTCKPCTDRGIECLYGNSKRKARSSLADSPRLRPEAPYPSRDDVPIVPIHNPGIAYHQAVNISARLPGIPARDISVSPEISIRLINTYFNCIHPLWPLLYKPLYAALNYGSPTDMMSPSLVAAIYSIASCVDRPLHYTENSIVQRYPEPWQFFEGALDLLQGTSGASGRVANLFEPSISNCQVLTILALQQHGRAEYARAAILCGLASSMAIELRLHRAPSATHNAVQNEIHSRLWWNLYILEKMMAFEMGRPVVLRFEESDCPFPSLAEADEFELMSLQMGTQSISKKNASMKLRTISGLHSAIKLAKIVEKIAREIYGIAARRAIRENQSVGEAKRLELWSALQDWEREMSGSSLSLDLSPELTSVPASVTNYVVHWHATIMLHRPFIARWSSNPAAGSSPDPHYVCLEAARRICSALEKYLEQLLGLPCDMVFSVFIAASTLLYHSKISKSDDGENRRQLQLCIRWLPALGKSWKSASARHQMLAEMYDLPAELRGQQDRLYNGGPSPSYARKEEHSYGSPAPRAIMDAPVPNDLPTPEDWTFLREFGDPTDEFYELDMQLRGMLDGEMAGNGSERMANGNFINEI